MKFLQILQLVFSLITNSIQWIALALIRFYQKYLSVLKKPSCRYYPTCSAYAYQAIQKYGPFRGGFMGIKRILRCHPWHKGGVDVVP
jgi:uncharacterized protein